MVPLGEVHGDVRAAVRALIDNYGAMGVISIIVQMVELDRQAEKFYGPDGPGRPGVSYPKSDAVEPSERTGRTAE